MDTSSESSLTTEKLIESVQEHFFSEDLALVERACAFAKAHYAELTHPTGEPYLRYKCNVAIILKDLCVDPVVIATAIISPPQPIAGLVLDDLRKKFKDEDEVLDLVEEVLHLDNLVWSILPITPEQNESKDRRETLQKMFLLAIEEVKSEVQLQTPLPIVPFQRKEKQIENLINMLLTATADFRALIIKLTEYQHFMRIITALPIPQQGSINNISYIQLAKITLKILAPLADRLGIRQLKSKLEDLSFQILKPDKFKEIAEQLAAQEEEQEKYINTYIIPVLQKELREFGIAAEIFGRAKHIYSIYQKMEAKQLSFEEINDLLGIRIIVETSEDCYNVQSILHAYWPPVTEVYEGKAGRDWIANPKQNLYQSLHTTILMEGQAVEVQIRTRVMHKIAEYGVVAVQDAVHWRYKESKTYKKSKVPREIRTTDRNRQLAQLRKILNGEQDSTIPMLKHLLKGRIFVITPEGHVIDLPAGATPLDFAYRIHTDLGHRYAGAKIGEHLVRTDYELKSGEIVELIPSRIRKGPSPEWLSIVRTRQARNKIRQWLNRQKRKVQS